jgi:hypothetical protein
MYQLTSTIYLCKKWTAKVRNKEYNKEMFLTNFRPGILSMEPGLIKKTPVNYRGPDKL